MPTPILRAAAAALALLLAGCGGGSGGAVFAAASACATPSVTLRGFTDLGPAADFRLDVAIVIDRSGSTGRRAFDVNGDGTVDTTLDVEVAAARCFASGLDYRTTRVA